MALMFQRLARNFVKNGYFPTDEDTIARVLAALQPAEGPMRILDPCAGEGVALAETAHWLGQAGAAVESFGVEYDAERAWHAKTLLGRCLHADLMDTVISPRAFGLLWFNPPYGDLVSDQAGASAARWKGRKRLEKLFYERSAGTLQFGGIMVCIIPAYSLDVDLSAWIARHFTQVRVFRAATDQFQQVVVLGVRKRSTEGVDKALQEQLRAIGQGNQVPDVLPEEWMEPPYPVPAAQAGGNTLKFMSIRLDGPQLAEEVSRGGNLWERFGLTFQTCARPHRRPLRALSRWHLALALSAGQISGAVKASDGRLYLVRGDTHKEKDVRVEHEVNEQTGSVRETRIHTDKFVPMIRAIDFTPDSDTFGSILTIR